MHFVQTNGTSCRAALVTEVEHLDEKDYESQEESLALDQELAYVKLQMFAPDEHGSKAMLRAAHSPLPTAGTYHSREECRRGL